MEENTRHTDRLPRVAVTGTRGIPRIMGGVETHCEQLFPRVASQGFDVTVMRRGAYAADNLEEWNGVKLVTIPSPRRKALEAIVHTFRAIREAHRRGADIVHIHAVGPALLAPYAKWLGMKVVFTHHGPDYDRDKWGRAARTALRMGERMGCRFADRVIVISDVIRKLIADNCGRTEGVELIPNGVPAPQPVELPDYFAQLGIKPGKFILGMCRFVPEKNLHHLIEACSRIDMKGYKLVLAGDTEFPDAYSRSLKLAAERNGVVLTGFIKGDKLHSLLTACRCFCLPSSHEGLPIALLEAMSYGAQVVVSDIPANLEVGLDSQCYFPCGDIDALAARLQQMVDTPPQRLTYDMSRYDWDNIATRTAALYTALLNE